MKSIKLFIVSLLLLTVYGSALTSVNQIDIYAENQIYQTHHLADVFSQATPNLIANQIEINTSNPVVVSLPQNNFTSNQPQIAAILCRELNLFSHQRLYLFQANKILQAYFIKVKIFPFHTFF